MFQRTVSTSTESRLQTQPPAAPRRVAGNGTVAERGKPQARDLQKQKVCNLAAAFHTPYSSCPCSRHRQVRGVPPQNRMLRVQKHNPGPGERRSLRLVSTGGAASRGGSGSVPSSGAQRAPTVGKQQPQSKEKVLQLCPRRG